MTLSSRKLETDGCYSTVVVLPLRSPSAATEALRMIDELLEDEAPFNLFLDRLAEIEFRIPDDLARLWTRSSGTSYRGATRGGNVEVDRVWLDTAEYVRFSRVLDLDEVNAAIEESRGGTPWRQLERLEGATEGVDCDARSRRRRGSAVCLPADGRVGRRSAQGRS